MLLDAFPNDDRWVAVGRAAAAWMAVTGVPLVFLPTRSVLARLLKPWGVEGGGLEGIGRRGREFYAVTAGLWVVCVGLGAIPGRAGEFLPLLGVFGAFALGFLFPGAFCPPSGQHCSLKNSRRAENTDPTHHFFFPALLFIVLFHLRSPLSIIFPPASTSSQPPPTPLPGADPSTPAFPPNPFAAHQLASDALLARKERQLQKRRTSKRIWQDLVFFLAGVPLSVLVTGWTGGRMLGFW